MKDDTNAQIAAIKSLGETLASTLINEWYYEHKGLDYVIQQNHSGPAFVEVFQKKYHWWDVYLTGIRPPIYDGDTASGITFGKIDPIFKNLVKIPKGQGKFTPNSDGLGDVGYYHNEIYCPCATHIHTFEFSKEIAIDSIERYLKYKDRIEIVIKKIEEVYGIDPKTRKSTWRKDLDSETRWGNEEENKRFEEKYPQDTKEFLRQLIKEFRLDYLEGL